MPVSTDERISQLSTASLRRLVEPDEDVTGQVDPTSPIVDRSLLSCAGLDLELTEDQWKTLAREEVAAITDAGIRFEALLLAGFGRMLADIPDLTDPRAVYVLHELGEETRHSRLFIRLLDQLHPTARNPFLQGPIALVDRIATRFVLARPVLFCVMVLAGEEIPDLIQRRAAEHPDTDRFFAQVARYHRAEEARHLAFARLLLPELWRQASRLERFLIRWCGPAALRALSGSLVHPGVYETAGLPGWVTWRAVQVTDHHCEFNQAALGSVANALTTAGVFGDTRRLTRPWRRLVATAAA
jgi:hypothetical protein